MKKKSIIINSGFSILIICLSIYGFKNNALALPILQLFLSKYFIENLITIFNYSSNVDSTLKDIRKLFSNGISKDSMKNVIIQGQVIYIIIKYETNISHSKLFLDSNIFNNLNTILTNDWKQIKNKYSIE